MAEKKETSDWVVATAYMMIAGLFIPFLIGMIYVFAIAPVFGLQEETVPAAVASVLVSFVALWLGIRYSARYIVRTYRLADRERIIELSTVFFGFLAFLLLIGDVQSFLNAGENIYAYIDAAGIIAGVALFYFASHQYLE